MPESRPPKKAPPPGLAPHQVQFVLTLLLILSAFAIGVLWTKLQFYEKGGTTVTAGAGQAQTSPLAIDSLKKYAKELKLNESQFTTCLDQGKYASAVNNDVSYGGTLGVSGTPAFFINGKFLGGAFPYESFKEIIDKELGGTGSTNPKDYSLSLQKAFDDGSFNPVVKAVDLGNAQRKGNSNAKVIVVEFSDFECPYCGRFFSQTLPSLQKEYIDTGKVLFAYKQFPLTSIHANAQKAAEASLCAADEGKFWEYHDRLFKSQQ